MWEGLTGKYWHDWADCHANEHNMNDRINRLIYIFNRPDRTHLLHCQKHYWWNSEKLNKSLLLTSFGSMIFFHRWVTYIRIRTSPSQKKRKTCVLGVYFSYFHRHIICFTGWRNHQLKYAVMHTHAYALKITGKNSLVLKYFWWKLLQRVVMEFRQVQKGTVSVQWIQCWGYRQHFENHYNYKLGKLSHSREIPVK